LTAPDEICRLDVWLWRARLSGTRTEAARTIEKGRVRLSRAGQQTRMSKPGYRVRPGDIVTLMRGERLVEARIVGFGSRRGPPAEAAGLYEDLNRAAPDAPDG
jgi:ribosome-associated heat shock protein Hsp15